MKSFTFGDLFQYKDKEYIYLSESDDIVFAAKILNLEDSKLIDQFCQNKIKKNSPHIETNLLYSYVILETKELKQRAAHFKDTGNENFEKLFFTPLPISLCEEDLKAIKDEITKKRCISLRLKELVKDIQI